MYYKTLSNNNNGEEVVMKLKADTLEKSLYYRDEGNVREKLLADDMQQDAINNNFIFLQMNIVVSLFAHENDEKRVIRFKKIPADEMTSEFD